MSSQETISLGKFLAEQQAPKALSEYVFLRNNSRPCSPTSSYALAFGNQSYRGALVRALADELRTFCRRILAVLRTRPDRRGVILDLLPYLLSQEKQRQARADCSSDMRKLSDLRWSPTALDSEVWRQAWTLGVEWAMHNSHTKFLEYLPSSRSPETILSDLKSVLTVVY